MQFERLQKLTEKLDDFLRIRDFRQNRTVGGRLDRWFGIGRHTVAALILPCLLCAFLILASPSRSRIQLAIFAFGVSAAVIAGGMRVSNRKRWPLVTDLVLQVSVVLLTAIGIWSLGGDEYRETGVYRHLLVPVASALGIALLTAGAFVGLMFRPLRAQSKYGEYLTRTELFASRGPVPRVTIGTIVTSLLSALFRAPLALLTLPAMAVLISPPVWLREVTVTVFA